jgi:tryptophan synthase alpha chain
MSRLKGVLRKLTSQEEGALMPHVYFGDPSYGFSVELLKTLARSGADILEVGIPFSDPIADGPTFIAACERALRGGTTPDDCLRGLTELRESGVDLPVVVTAYANTIMANGNLLEGLAEAGVDGLIVPDMPFEESGDLMEKLAELEMDLILQVAPTTSERRLKRILSSASGFVYVINFEGVTGPREDIPEGTLDLIRRIRGLSDIPLVAGFGISRPEHAEKLIAGGADGVAVGSIFAEIYSARSKNPFESLREISEMARRMKEACVNGFKRRKPK